MKSPQSRESHTPLDDMMEHVIDWAHHQGFQIISTEKNTNHQIYYILKTENIGFEQKVFFEINTTPRKLGETHIKHTVKLSQKELADKVMIYAPAGLTGEAMKYCEKFDIEQIKSLEYQKLSAPEEKLAEAKIFEKIFKFEADEQKVRAHFEKKKRRFLFGLLGDKEEIESIQIRLAPIACYKLTKKVTDDAINKGVPIMAGENRIYMNLHTCELYWMYLGFSGGKKEMKSSNIFRRMMDLPEKAIQILAFIFEQGEIEFDKLDQGYTDYLYQNMNLVTLLESFHLISVTRHGGGYVFNTHLPEFTSERYDLKRYFDVEDKVESKYEVDEIHYPPNGLLELLKDFFVCDGVFEDVVYMPYYRCRYVDNTKRVRFDHLQIFGVTNG